MTLFQHALLHGTAGCVFAEVQGKECAGGAAAGITSSLLAGYYKNTTDGPKTQTQLALTEFTTAVAGAIATGDQSDAATYGQIGRSAFENNYLTHKQWKDLNAALAKCGEDKECINKLVSEYTTLSSVQNAELEGCISRGDVECVQGILQELRTLDGEYASIMEDFEAVTDGAGLSLSDDAALNDLIGLDMEGMADGQRISTNRGQYDGAELDAYRDYAAQNCRDGQDCLSAFSRHRQEEFERSRNTLAAVGFSAVAIGLLAPEVIMALGACATNPICWGQASAVLGDAGLGMSGATVGQTFYTVGSGAAIGSQLVMRHGDEILGVLENGKFYRPVSQTVDDTGRILVQSADGTLAYIDNSAPLMPTVATNRVLSPIDEPQNLVGFRRDHIMNRHGPGSGQSGKTEFPANWNEDRILHNISDVATDPTLTPTCSSHGCKVVGVRDGIEIEVVFYPDTHPTYGGQISTAYPINVPANP